MSKADMVAVSMVYPITTPSSCPVIAKPYPLALQFLFYLVKYAFWIGGNLVCIKVYDIVKGLIIFFFHDIFFYCSLYQNTLWERAPGNQYCPASPSSLSGGDFHLYFKNKL